MLGAHSVCGEDKNVNRRGGLGQWDARRGGWEEVAVILRWEASETVHPVCSRFELDRASLLR